MLTPRARQGGMTLTEILIALGILAMIMMVAGPASLAWIQNMQVRSAAESVAAGMKQARIEAINRNTVVAFELLDPASSAWHVCLCDVIANTCKAATPDLVAKGASEGGTNARYGVETTFSSFTTALGAGTGVPALVAFDSFGRIAPTSPVNIARVDVRNPTMNAANERRLSITVGVSGQIRMCDPALTLATNPMGCQ